MDRLISVFSVYDFFSYVFSGGALIAGVYWTIAGVPSSEPGTATFLGLIAAAYITGHLVQAVGTVLERLWWNLRGGWPSNFRLTAPAEAAEEPGNRLWTRRPYTARFQAYLDTALVAEHGADVSDLSTPEKFALARADLRARGADGRAELMNTLYAFTRGLGTTSLMLTIVFIIAWIAEGAWDPFGWAWLVTLFASMLFLSRFDNFGHRFADQVWHDFAAGIGNPTGA